MNEFNPKLHIVLLLLTVLSNAISAQDFEGKRYFTTDTVFTNPDQVGYRLTKESAIYTFDGVNVKIENLRHIEENNTRYKVMGVDREGTLQYSKRILDGSSIDIYSKNEKAFEIYPLKSYVEKERVYMEIDNGPLQKITHKNLQPFALDKLEIANQLKEANKFRILNGVLAGAAVTSLILVASRTIDVNPNKGMVIPIAFLIPIGLTAKPLKKRYYNVVDIINSQP